MWSSRAVYNSGPSNLECDLQSQRRPWEEVSNPLSRCYDPGIGLHVPNPSSQVLVEDTGHLQVEERSSSK